MGWNLLKVAADGSHHLDECGAPAYAERFDEVLKFHAPGLAPVIRDGEAWHIQTDGAAAYRRRFSKTFGFYEGLAAVAGPQGWHHITPKGIDLYPERHGWCGNFQGGRCAVRDFGGSYLHLAPDGQPAYAERWRYAGDYRDGIAVVQGADGRCTHIDSQGSVLHGHWFLDLDTFHKGFARARDEGGWFHIDRNGKSAYSNRFAMIEAFYNGQARVERFDGTLEVIDEAAKTLIKI